MKMLTAAVVVSQVLLAAGCRPAPCDKGCKFVTHYEPKFRFGEEKCTRVGEVKNMFVPITSCDAVDTQPQLLGDCIEGKHGEALCTKENGLCVKYQFVRAMSFSCDCTAETNAPATKAPLMECDTDKNCPLGEFCRTKRAEGFGCSEEKECVPYATMGQQCGGMRLPCMLPQCAPGLSCQGKALLVDGPGQCKPVPVCMAMPRCPLGSFPDPKCTRLDFATRACHKEITCGRELACRGQLLE